MKEFIEKYGEFPMVSKLNIPEKIGMNQKSPTMQVPLY